MFGGIEGTAHLLLQGKTRECMLGGFRLPGRGSHRRQCTGAAQAGLVGLAVVRLRCSRCGRC